MLFSLPKAILNNPSCCDRDYNPNETATDEEREEIEKWKKEMEEARKQQFVFKE